MTDDTVTPDSVLCTRAQAGDWHDTLKGPYSWERNTPVRVKMAADRFTGAQVVHCHYLWHQDRGMMYLFQIRGEEGRTFGAAQFHQPTCYSETPLPPARFAGAPSASKSNMPPPAASLAAVGLLLTTVLLYHKRAWLSLPKHVLLL